MSLLTEGSIKAVTHLSPPRQNGYSLCKQITPYFDQKVGLAKKEKKKERKFASPRTFRVREHRLCQQQNVQNM